MRLSKSKLFAVQVANFAAKHGMSGRDVVELVTLAEKAFSAGERATGDGSERAKSAENNTADRFERFALECGFGTEWNGLSPTLNRLSDGREFYIPCDCTR